MDACLADADGMLEFAAPQVHLQVACSSRRGEVGGMMGNHSSTAGVCSCVMRCTVLLGLMVAGGVSEGKLQVVNSHSSRYMHASIDQEEDRQLH